MLPKKINILEAKSKLSQILTLIENESQQFIIFSNGKPISLGNSGNLQGSIPCNWPDPLYFEDLITENKK